MALAFKTVEQAYEIFHLIQEGDLNILEIPSFPQDMGEWDESKKENPPENVVLGWGKKSDGGWESLSFFVERPTTELINSFLANNTIKSNTHICEPYFRNEKFWCFGWF